MSPPAGLRRALPLLALLLLTGCRDTPDEVLRSASEAAAAGDIVEMRALFSVATTHRLEQAWKLQAKREGQEWEALATKLVFDGQPLEVDPNAVAIHGEYARVTARAGANSRDYYLRKEDGRWRIELGGGTRFRRAKKADDAEKGKGEDGEDEEKK